MIKKKYEQTALLWHWDILFAYVNKYEMSSTLALKSLWKLFGDDTDLPVSCAP